jgi:hypothetical protein
MTRAKTGAKNRSSTTETKRSPTRLGKTNSILSGERQFAATPTLGSLQIRDFACFAALTAMMRANGIKHRQESDVHQFHFTYGFWNSRLRNNG